MTTEMVNTVINPLADLSLDEKTYYRSRVFTAESGMNPLLCAASPLLLLLTRIAYSNNQPDFQQLADSIVHELKTFESRCIDSLIDPDSIGLGRSWLMVALHTTLSRQPWYSEWQSVDPMKSALDSSQNYNTLLTLLEKPYQQANRHLELLELAYVCLSLAPVGERNLALLDPLYQRIRHYRGDATTQLFLSSIAPNLWEHRASSKSWPVWVTILVSVVLLSVFYVGFTLMINLNARVIKMTSSIDTNKVILNEDL